MKNLQKMGGIAALYEAVAYIAAMAFFIVALDYINVVDPAQQAALLVENQAAVALMTLMSYVIFGAALVVLSLAIYDRLKQVSPAMSQVATAFGLIWAALVIASGMVHNSGLRTIIELYEQAPEQAVLTWTAIDAVTLGLGGEAEIVGGIWMLLVSLAALRTGRLPNAMNYLGIVIGIVGIISAIPGLTMLNSIFGITQIIWFIWVGIVMLRRSPEPVVETSQRVHAAS